MIQLGFQQQLPHEFRHRPENSVPSQREPIRQERHTHAAGLHVPYPADHSPHAGPVQGIQADGNVPQVRVIPTAPEQNAAP